MKKLLSLVLALMMALMASVPALAECGCGECESCACTPGVLMAKSETVAVAGVYTGLSWWALSESQHVFGLKAPDEAVAALPAPSAGKSYIRGAVETGLIREKGTMQALYGGAVYGLRSIEVTIRIKQEYIALAETIVHERLGADAEITANTLIACTNWWRGETVAHIFFTSSSARVAIGTVTVNGGADTILLYAGDFNGDGTLELGFAAGWTVKQPEPPKSPEKTPCDKKPCQPCNKKPCGKGSGCTVNIQINILSIVKNVFTRMCQ